MSLTKRNGESSTQSLLKDANWTKVAQLKHVDPCFTNSSAFYMGHNDLKRQPAPLLTTENFLNPWEKKCNSFQTSTFYSYPSQSCHHKILLSLTVSLLGLEPDILFVFAWGHLSTTPTYQVVLRSQAVPSDLEMEVRTEDLTSMS